MAYRRSFTKKRPLRSLLAVQKTCYFCDEGIDYIDYKNIKLMQKYLSRYMKIEPRRRTGTCARHQRQIATALKRSRHLALIPFVLK
ncbi:30S ribosomal protein S18 [candidate division Kazan bacterium]|uniref:Small ribosomal subunit protein bS18 n=1 Tax=candidate division Kazan bacterium TaxID=2202143 RepID=A0A420ZBH5_UNCK3|nr:MAG: 30S ribosomal protein S18 [candidate division Kazan bacterium]